MKNISTLSLLLSILVIISCESNDKKNNRPNILIAIADDQSYPHTGI